MGLRFSSDYAQSILDKQSTALGVSIQFHPDAHQELQEGSAFYAQAAGSFVALSFADEVERVAYMLAEHPMYGKSLDDKTRLFALRRFPYSLIYRPTAQGIRILAVAHQKRKPGYWNQRT